jgi:hypothetical protein
MSLIFVPRSTPHRHLWADCLEDVGASTSHKPMDLHGLLQEELATHKLDTISEMSVRQL